jgi:hypothetical protein
MNILRKHFYIFYIFVIAVLKFLAISIFILYNKDNVTVSDSLKTASGTGTIKISTKEGRLKYEANRYCHLQL